VLALRTDQPGDNSELRVVFYPDLDLIEVLKASSFALSFAIAFAITFSLSFTLAFALAFRIALAIPFDLCSDISFAISSEVSFAMSFALRANLHITFCTRSRYWSDLCTLSPETTLPWVQCSISRLELCVKLLVV